MKNSTTTLYIAIVLVFASVGFVSTPAKAYDVINGNACIAANLTQALELQWNQARVLNPATNPNSRFVTCTISTGTQYIDTTPLNVTTVESGGVEAYFDADAAGDAEAACIFREMNSGFTGNAGQDTAIVTIENGDAAAANTVRGTFEEADGLTFGLILGLFGNPTTTRTYTLTCELDPGVGINAYWAVHTPPA